MSVGGLQERTDRPAIVRFEREAIEDRAQSIVQGKFVGKDVDFALITPPYSKDTIKMKVTSWMSTLDADVKNGRLPAEWQEKYLESYRRWQNGQEMPPDGNPIRGWPVLSPAQQNRLLSINILTVEDLAGANAEGMQRIGMGAVEMKNKAVAWLRAASDRGPLTQQMASLQETNRRQAEVIETLNNQVQALTLRVQGMTVGDASETESTSLDDILPEAEPEPRRRARR